MVVAQDGPNVKIKPACTCAAVQHRGAYKTGGVDFGRPYLLGWAGLDDSLLQKYIADSAALWTGHVDELPLGTVGGTIGTHVGPGAIAVAFFQKR